MYCLKGAIFLVSKLALLQIILMRACSFSSERYSLLGVRKDYWHFISDSIPKDDGVKVVQAIPQVIKDSFICCKVAIIQWVFWNAFNEFEE